MGFAITLAVISFIIFFLVLLKELCKDDDLCVKNILLVLGESTLPAAASFLIGLIFSVIFTVIASNTVATESYVEECPIYALSATDSTYLCGSRVSSLTDICYEYKYIVSDEKGKHIESLSSSDVYFTNDVYFTEETDNPTLKIHKKRYPDGWYKFFVIESGLDDIDYYEFCVPESTISSVFSVDMKPEE